MYGLLATVLFCRSSNNHSQDLLSVCCVSDVDYLCLYKNPAGRHHSHILVDPESVEG